MYPAPKRLQMIGDAWASSCKSVVLRIPNVIVPSESTSLLNPAHPDFDKLAANRCHNLSTIKWIGPCRGLRETQMKPSANRRY
jgi:hypothetical protein